MKLTIGNDIQVGLLVIYLILSIVLIKEKQYPIAFYYIGCLVKDAAVFILAMFK